MATSTRFPPKWPHENLPFFEFKGFDDRSKTSVYRLDAEMLSEEECHIFFPVHMCEEVVIATMLEFYTFHPRTPLNEKYNISPLKVGNVEVIWCSFPKEFKEVCQRMAKAVGMKMLNQSKGLSIDSKKGQLLESSKEEETLYEELFGPVFREARQKVNKNAVARRDGYNYGSTLFFPNKENLLFFEGKREQDRKLLQAACNNAIATGNSVQESELD